MNIGRILKFLITGIVVGAVLFFAGFGIINLFNKAPEEPVIIQEEVTSEITPVTPPKIEIAPNQNADATQNSDQSGTSDSPIKIKPFNSNNDQTVSEGAEAEPAVTFGTLTLSTVNSVNGGPTNANFLIENSQGAAIALVKDTSTSTLSLPVGDYKITVSQGTQKVVRFLGVKTDQKGSEVFELDVAVIEGQEPPAALVEEGVENPAAPVVVDTSSNTTETPIAANDSTQTNVETIPATPTVPTVSAEGGLRLSALTESGKRPTVVSFYIQRLNGDNVKTFRNVKTQQLSLPAGKYTVTAKTDRSTSVKQVEVLATKGIHEIFLISDVQQPTQPATNNTAPVAQPQPSNTNNTPINANKEPGRLELFAQSAGNSAPVKSNFYVQMPNGEMVASKTYVDSIGYKLPPGQYRVIVRSTGYKDKTAMLNVRPGQTRREVFKLSSVNQRAPAPAPVPSNTNRQPAAPSYGGLTVNVVAVSDRSPLPAEIVITQPDGTPLKQAVGVSSASFDLPPRAFVIRITVDGLTTLHPVNIVKGKLAIKTISVNSERMSRQERRRLRRQQRQQRAQ